MNNVDVYGRKKNLLSVICKEFDAPWKYGGTISSLTEKAQNGTNVYICFQHITQFLK